MDRPKCKYGHNRHQWRDREGVDFSHVFTHDAESQYGAADVYTCRHCAAEKVEVHVIHSHRAPTTRVLYYEASPEQLEALGDDGHTGYPPS